MYSIRNQNHKYVFPECSKHQTVIISYRFWKMEIIWICSMYKSAYAFPISNITIFLRITFHSFEFSHLTYNRLNSAEYAAKVCDSSDDRELYLQSCRRSLCSTSITSYWYFSEFLLTINNRNQIFPALQLAWSPMA